MRRFFSAEYSLDLAAVRRSPHFLGRFGGVCSCVNLRSETDGGKRDPVSVRWDRNDGGSLIS